jgi:hypothetical protein
MQDLGKSHISILHVHDVSLQNIMEKFDSFFESLTFWNPIFAEYKKENNLIQTLVYTFADTIMIYLFYTTLKFQEKRAKIVNISSKKRNLKKRWKF